MNHKYIQDIYNIFQKITYKQLDVFLCGGASWYDKKKDMKHESYRDQIRDRLISSHPNLYNILYPEDLFMELLDSKTYDLLTLENILAANSDVILLVPESPGSFAELGAFANNESTASKLIIFQQQKFKRQHSFITQGPVDFMEKYYPGSVTYFNNDLSKIFSQVNRAIGKRFPKYYKGAAVPFKDVDQLTGLVTFEILLLFFYEDIQVADFYNEIGSIYDKCVENKKSDKDYKNVLILASVKYLFKKGWLKKGNSSYALTHDGINKAYRVLDLLAYKKSDYDIDGLRLKILHEELMAG